MRCCEVIRQCQPSVAAVPLTFQLKIGRQVTAVLENVYSNLCISLLFYFHLRRLHGWIGHTCTTCNAAY